MATKRIELIQVLQRDGTSQKQRSLAALDPAYVLVDERTAADFVEFARKLGPALIYHGADGRHPGGFGSFIGSVGAADIAEFLAAPERFDPATAPALFRPHFVLFLTFVKLLEKAQVELNTLTARHLDFYYRRFLAMVEKGPSPDRVNLIVNLAARGREVLVPRGSLLNAGPDSLGRDQIYATDRDLVVNRAQIARLQSVYVDRRRIGFKELRARLLPGEVGLPLLSLALGDPEPGDPLPPYGEGYVDKALLSWFDTLTQITSETTGFYLSLAELRDLMRLKELTSQLTTELSPAQLDEQWSKLNALLELGGQRKRRNPAYRLPTGTDPRAFAKNAAAAIGSITAASFGVLDLEYYFLSLRHLEAYFHMSAEAFHQIYQPLFGGADPDWDRVDLILEAAYEEKVRSDRRKRFAAIHTAQPAAGLDPLLREAVGLPEATEEDLIPLLGKDSSLDSLREAVQSGSWDRVYSILEVAQSNRLGASVAQIEEWVNLHPAPDATKVGVRGPAEEVSDSSRWATFGLPQSDDPNAPPAPVLGWAVSAPLLQLREGTRTITLTLGLDPESPNLEKLTGLLNPPSKAGEAPPPLPLMVEASTEKGWIPCPVMSVTIGTYAALSGSATGAANAVGVQFVLSFAKGAAALTALPPAPTPPMSAWPVLRILLRSVWSAERKQYLIRYRELGTLLLLCAHVKVQAKGLRPQKLQSDDGVLDAQKPFLPFGATPAAGSRLLIGHTELVGKKLDELDFYIKWMGAPASLKAHYENYADAPANAPAEFTARVSLVDRTQERDLNKMASLFSGDSGAADVKWTLPLTPSALATSGPEDAPTDDVSAWTRYVQWELNKPDFQHSVFAARASQKALGLAAAIANRMGKTGAADIVAADYVVNPPYTPKIQSLTFDYTASQEVLLSSGAASAADALRLLHIHPFGHSDVEAERTAAGVPLLPRYEHDGELYIGLQGVAPPQTVSLFFKLAEGTSDPELPPQSIKWSYLHGDRFVPMGSGVVLDSTRGLLNTGIVELALKPVEPSTRLPGGLYWVRAAIARNTSVVCDTIAIHTQGVSATFQDRDNAPDRFSQPLPPGTLTKFATQIPLIAGVSQPYASLGGRRAEDSAMWATRVSERLRHKRRALSIWDYEQLILERFPEVYKAKCLPAGPEDPGKVGIVIIPDIKNLLPSDPFAPKAPARLLADISDYLSTKMPAFAAVTVRNARYVPVRVRLRVRFREEGNQGYYIQKLNDELNRFLSPWAYEEGSDIVIGGRIYANSIIDFVDRRSYVDYVAGVALFVSDGERFIPAGRDYVAAERPDDVLVAARSHIIDVLHDAVYEERLLTGIGFMKVELDFIVRPDPLPTDAK